MAPTSQVPTSATSAWTRSEFARSTLRRPRSDLLHFNRRKDFSSTKLGIRMLSEDDFDGKDRKIRESLRTALGSALANPLISRTQAPPRPMRSS